MDSVPPLSFFVIHSLSLSTSLPCLCLSISFHMSSPSASSKFDSVSLAIRGSMEGELSLMDNLSRSVCQFYALPPKTPQAPKTPKPRRHSSDEKVNNHQSDDSLIFTRHRSHFSEKSWGKKMKIAKQKMVPSFLIIMTEPRDITERICLLYTRLNTIICLSRVG